MYNNPYMNTYNPQITKDRIDNQIAQLQQMKEQLPQAVMQSQQPSINQTFQLAPNSSNGMRYANSLEDVSKEMVYVDTPFFSNDLSIMWLKSPKGNIKSFELKEIVQKDEKDLIIESLQFQLAELKKGMMNNEQSINTNDDESAENEKPTSVSKVRTTKTK